jgi:nucleotide-binding universal stress UspA family protein
MILICYDGSPDAKSAIEHGGALLKGESAAVLSVWQPFMQLLSRTYLGFGLVPDINQEEIDQAARKSAEDRAAEGAELARAAGLDAHPRTATQDTTTAEAILSEAAAVEASAILMGSRGLTGLGSVLLGSVSHAVIQHADRAVIVVPSAKVAEERQRARSAD